VQSYLLSAIYNRDGASVAKASAFMMRRNLDFNDDAWHCQTPVAIVSKAVQVQGR
jgi:hypothetical protein